ncbi:30S ribosomal protein S12 methylthiotransferase RimO [Pseudobacteriovorax antillogorgiicola]|uniref:Ribosomal protein uS12 methylthiotransferase RimO n=1 Tax=Pseudobacteriovorax antillogorgiicola TaxID=1513793 RepID=A0A1Y6B6D0_9BACT|nr:30S ribosomal protein S12 methylthiotransferase RimO [Pseudobacteriovorax antillogorgiicola]TCS59537.1 SSU ribosomal protein S12P methylthiotransferase [Pseudobacteriovorax antillogorgiicola]SME87805.1 SSU ribosomal protein S12P methylthiotransferase [Pseudobacteriovorax antillogorgiicola]
MDATASQNRKVHLISLGCARNRVDSEVMLGTLMEQDWTVTQDADDADAVIINTCGFIGPAKEESVNTILEASQLKEKNPNMKVVVAGCLTQRYKTKLVDGLPEVDLFVGTDEFPKIGDFLSQDLPQGTINAKRTHYLYDGSLPKQNTLSRWSAYVKVAEGCQHNCAFCIIPAIRGELRSRPIPNVMKEVEKLAAEGVQEINLIAQDLAAYGRDWGSSDLLDLLKQMVEVEGIRWIRLLYVYPENISDEFVEFLANNDKIVKYLDIPVQHASNGMLRSMNREVTKEEIASTVAKLRRAIPEIAIRTSVMVGFPGETDEDFQELKAFVKEQRFDHLGCFSYSQEEGTVAGRMKNQIDEDLKAQRQAEIMEVQKDISAENLEKYVGTYQDVLVVGTSEETDLLMEGRLSTQAPEVDGIVYINDGDVKVGEIQRVYITESHDYDLVGKVVPLS